MSSAKEPQGTSVLSIEGEMTVYRAAELKQTLLAAFDLPGSIQVNLAKVTELDSAGVQLLMLVRQLAETRNRELHLVACSHAVLEVLALLNLESYVDKQPSSVTGGDPAEVTP